MTDLPSSGSDGGGLEWLGLINSSPHQISKESQVLPTPSDIRQRLRRFLLDMEERISLGTRKSICQRAMTLRQNQQLLASLAPTSNPRALEQAIFIHEQAQQHMTQLLSLLQPRGQQSQLQPSQQPLMSQQAHQLPVDCSGDTPRRSARLKAKATESPEGEKPTKRERRSSGKKGKADKKDAEDGENKATRVAEDAAAAAGAQESTDVEMKDAEGNADKAGKVHAEGDTPRRSARLKAKPTESPEGEKPTKRERRSSGGLPVPKM